MERYDSSASNMNEISVNYAINTNNNVVGGDILMDSFTKESRIKFHNRYWNLKEYTLEQMNEKGNKRLQEAMPLFESCLKKGDSGVTMSDLGFTKYNF